METPPVSLERLLAELVDRCREKGIGVFRGFINPEEHEVVDWDEEEGDLGSFLDVALQSGARMVYVHAFKFTEHELAEALEEAAPERLRQLEAFRAHLGDASSVTVMFRFDGLFHSWTKWAPWHDAFSALCHPEDESEEDTYDETEEDYAQAQRERKRLLDEAATALAHDPRFAECRNQAARLALLRRVKPDIEEEFPTEFQQRSVVQEAQAIYELDVRPKLASDSRQRVLELKQQGFSVSQIASRVSLKAAEVKRLLEE